MPNKVGLLSKITTAIAGTKVNIIAFCAYEMKKKAHFMLVTDNNAKTKKTLSKIGVDAEVDDVIMVEMSNRVGGLKKVADKIAASDIDINFMYVTVGSSRSAMGVFKTDDNRKAIRVINKKDKKNKYLLSTEDTEI